MPKEYTSPKTGKKRKTKAKPAQINPRMLALMNGELKVEDLTDEEIKRGQLLAEDGTFRGRKTDVVPRKFFDLVTQENLRRWQAKVQQELEPSLNVLKEIAQSPRAPADARYKSAVYLIERAAGKVPEKTEMKLEVQPWEEGLDGLLFDTGEEKSA